MREGVNDCRHQLSGVAMGMVWVAEATAVGELVEAFGWAQATSKVAWMVHFASAENSRRCHS